MKIRWMYVTTPSVNAAKEMASTLVREHLVACANILPGMQSIYPWKGKIEEGQECVLILKTTEIQEEAVTQRVRELHEDEVPCVLSLSVEGGNPEFLEWIKEETKGS